MVTSLAVALGAAVETALGRRGVRSLSRPATPAFDAAVATAQRPSMGNTCSTVDDCAALPTYRDVTGKVSLDCVKTKDGALNPSDLS